MAKNEAEYIVPPPHSIHRGFLDPGTHASLLVWAIENEAKFEASLVGGGDDAKCDPSRRISLCASDFGPLMAVLRQCVLNVVPTLIADLRVTPFEPCGVELDLVANNDGAFFKRHIDTFLGDARKPSDRVLSVVYYFHAEPKAFSGGALRLYSFGRTEHECAFADVQPEQNMLVAFPSWVPHEVLPVTCPSGRFSDSRFNVNCWVHRHSKKQFSVRRSEFSGEEAKC